MSSDDMPVLYSDIRSSTIPKLRENSSKAKYHLRFRHGRNKLPNNASTRATERIDSLLQGDDKLAWSCDPPKHHWQIPPSQHISHYKISSATLKDYPEGQWKRKFLKEARRMNQMSRCRCRGYCFLMYCEGQNARKMEMRRNITADHAALEEEDLDAELARCLRIAEELNHEESITDSQWLLDGDVPKGCWDGLVDQTKISKKLWRSKRGRTILSGHQEQAVADQVRSEGDEWDFVEFLGFLSDAESWEDDFDSISCWST